jgi:4-aminobutyrate aminotransferase
VTTKAALTTIEIIEQEGLVENAAKLGKYMLEQLKLLKVEHPSIGDVRGRGLLLGVELVLNKKEKTPANDLAEDVLYRCLSKGLSFKISMGNVLTLSPPLIISKVQIDLSLSIINESLCEAEIFFGLVN